MKLSMVSKESELYKRVDEVLYYLWDPIGMCDDPGARDEYQDYVAEVCAFINKSNSIDELSNYLGTLQADTMGRPLLAEKNKNVAWVLLQWKEILDK